MARKGRVVRVHLNDRQYDLLERLHPVFGDTPEEKLRFILINWMKDHIKVVGP